MASDYSAFGGPALVADDLVNPDSATAAYAARDPQLEALTSPTAGNATVDRFQVDTDPTGVKTKRFLESKGQAATLQTVLSAKMINGKEMPREWLMDRPEGQRLLSIIARNREGNRRGFLEAVTDVGPSDLPFMSLIGTQAGSIAASVRVSDAFHKLQDGKELSDDEALSATLYMAESRRNENGTWGATVGDIIRAAPGFMLEFLATGGVGSAARSGAAKAFKESIHFGMTRAAKTAARELVEAGAKRELASVTGKAVKLSAEEGLGKKVVDEVTAALISPKNGLMKNNPLYKGLSDDAIERMARNRAAYELGQFNARTSGGAVANSLVSTAQWAVRHGSQGLMDFGSWGTEEAVAAFSNRSTAGRALSDAVGTFFVEAPIKGALMYAPNAFVTKPLIGKAFGEDGRTVSAAQLGLEQAAYLTDNSELMDRAEWVASGMNLLEYVSENAGRGFSSLARSAGLGVEKLAGKTVGELPVHLVTPAQRAINETGDLIPLADSAITVGGKMREMIGKVLGTRQEFLAKVQKDEFRVAASALGISGREEETALRKAILSRNIADLPERVAAKAGSDFEKFMASATRDAYDNEVKGLAYRNYARFAVANYMAKHNIGPESVMNLYEKMGYDGILGEMFEERYSDIAKGLMGLDDRKTHDFMSNLKEAVKGIYPGFDQLTAEAVGFAMPLVTRAVTMRSISRLGGTGKLSELRERLDAMDDAFRLPNVEEMTPGNFFASNDRVMSDLEKRISDTEKEVAEERAAGNEDAALGLENQLKTMRTEAERRRVRHEKMTGLVNAAVEGEKARLEKAKGSALTTEELARINSSLMLNIPMLTEEQYRAGEDEFNRNILPTLDQVDQSVIAQEGLVSFANELAEQLYLMDNPGGNSSVKWLRSAAQKIVGFTGAIVTGDMSLVSANPAKYIARDMGLSKTVCDNLKKGFADEWKRQKDAVQSANPYAGFDEITAATREKFATQAAKIMKASLLASQIRSFSSTDMLDQAIGQVAREQGYSVDTAGQRLARFADGKFDEASAVSFGDFYSKNKEAVDGLRDEIAVATADLLTTKLTTSTDRKALMNAIRLPASSEIAKPAVYELAMRMAGFSFNSIRDQRIDEGKPVETVLRESALGRINDDVASYVAAQRRAGLPVDGMAYASLADSLNLSYDGTDRGLEERNRKIDAICELLDFGRDPSRIVLSKEIAYDRADTRFQRSHAVTLFGRIGADGLISIEKGYDENGVLVTDTKSADEWRKEGYVRVEPKTVITQRQNLWTDDMYEMLRQLGEIGAYRTALGPKNENQHPMLREYTEKEVSDFIAAHPEFADQSADNVHEALARDVLRREMALAANAIPVDNGASFDVANVPAGRTVQDVEAMWRKLYDKDTGYMTLGERILSGRGVTFGDPVSLVAGYRAGEYARRRYNFNLKTGNGTVGSAEHFVPIDVANGEDYIDGLLSSHLSRAYATHARLLGDALRGSWADFAKGVDAIIERRLSADNLDDATRAELRRIQALVTEVDRTVVDENGNARTVRGIGLTQQAFVELASTFALFQDVRRGAAGLVNSTEGRALASLAREARMLPSWAGFLNVVDLTLGGDGFLSEYLRNGKKSDGADLRGIRRLLQIVNGSADAFAETVRSALPGGRSYNDFLEDCVKAATSLAKNPVSVVKAKEVSAKDRAELEAIAARPDSASKHLDFLGKLSQAVGLEGGKLTAFLTEAVRQSSDQTARDAIASTELAGRLAEGEKAVVDASVRLINAERELRGLNERIAKEAKAIRDLEREGKDTSASVAEMNRIRDEIADRNAAVRALQKRRLDAIEAASAGRAGSVKGGKSDVSVLLPRQNTVVTKTVEKVNDRFGEYVDEDPMSIAGLETDRDRDLNDLFSEQVADRILSENHVLTSADARLAANSIVRAAMSANSGTGNEGTVSESSFLRTFDTMFPGTAAEDRAYVLQMFREANARRELEGKTWEQLTQNGEGWGFETDDRDENDVSDVSFNRTAVNEYDSEALSSFLAAAQLCSPETGRNFQAFATSVREITRDCVANADADTLSDEAKDALAFLDRLMNPRADKVGTTFNERKARYDKFISDTLNDTERVRGIVRTLLRGGKDGKPVSRKGAFLLSYLTSLPVNVRLNFTDLISSSSVTSPVAVTRRFDKGRSVWSAGSAVRPDYSVPVDVVYGVISPFVGMSADRLRETAKAIRSSVVDTTGLRKVTPDGRNIRLALEGNGRILAEALAPFFGRESVVYASLTSQIATRHRIQGGVASESSFNLTRQLVDAMTPDATGRIPLIESLASVLDATANAGRVATRELLFANTVTMFTTGDLSKGAVTMAPSTSQQTDLWNTLIATYEDAQPKTVMSARVDQLRDDGAAPKIAIASRGVVPLVSRFMDDGFGEMVKKYFPEATEDDIAQSRQDMTWPDRFRTPIVAKNVSKSYNAEEVLQACANSFATSKGAVWVPVYAGDHSSSIMIQVPAEVAKEARAAAAEETKKGPRQGETTYEFTLRRFEPFAREVCEAIGLNLLGDDTKRSALSSLEAAGTSTIGVKSENPDGSVQYGENRIHIVYNYDLRDACFDKDGKKGKDNESLFGTTMIAGYGAEQQRLRASTENTATLKVHAISTSGAELAFIKSLAVSPVSARGDLPEESAPGLLFKYLNSRLGKDGGHSTHILTDKDSYKIGVAGTKNITIEGKKVMDWLLAKLEEKARSGAFTLDAEGLDAMFPEGVDVNFAVKGGVKRMKLSELLPGVEVRTVDGFNGSTVDISFREDGMTLYSVANVSHDAKTVDNRTPRNHEIDAMAMAAFQKRNGFASNHTACDRVFDLIANWGLVSAALNSNEDVIRHLAEGSSGIAEKARFGEAYEGQNNREELARAVWSDLRKMNNVPMHSIDAPLISAAAEITKDGNGVYYYGKSRMYAAMMAGSQVFTEAERALYRTNRRLALCNANCTDGSFRYGWFLDEEKFRAEFGVTDDEAVLDKLDEVFTDLRDNDAVDKTALRAQIASCFLDHHGKRISERMTAAGRAYFERVSFEDLFTQARTAGANRVFDRSAVQIGSDRVFNDATGKSHVFLGGTAFGLPRTPSYNGSMWLQVVRAGLPVTERRIENEDGSVDFLPGRDAAVSPDPFTNRILGCDHDGDKTKMYMFAAEGGEVSFADPPTASVEDGFDRKAHFDSLYADGWFDRMYVDDSGRTVRAKPGEPHVAGEWYEMNKVARNRVSNSFVQCLFDMARDLPCKPATNERQQFADGPASKETKANPLVSDSDIEELLEEVGGKKVLTKGVNLGDPRPGAEVSKRAMDAANARAMIVSLASKLHIAWTDGGFADTLFRGLPQARWVDFMYLVDGLSNATFDDIKSQKCSRLGWKSNMMDSLITAVLLNNGKPHPPVTSAEMKEVLREFARGINKTKNQLFFMDGASDQSNDRMRKWVTEAFGGNTDFGVGKGRLLKFFGLAERTTDTGRTVVAKVAPTDPSKATVGEAIAFALERAGGDMSLLTGGNLNSPNASVRLGYLAYLAATVSGVDYGKMDGAAFAKAAAKVRIDLTDANAMERIDRLASEFVGFETMRSTLATAGSYAQSVNYLNADAGNESQASRADSIVDSFDENAGSEYYEQFRRMNAATSATFDIGYRLITAATEARKERDAAKDTMADIESDGTDSAKEAVAALRKLSPEADRLDSALVRTTDRNALQANKQMVVYILAQLRSFNDGKGPFADPQTAFDTFARAGELVAHGNESGFSKVLSMRYGIESAFDLMYRLAASSTESLDNNVFSYLRLASDGAYRGEARRDMYGDVYYPDNYGGAGHGLRRIRPAFRGGSEEIQNAAQALVADVVSGKSFSGERKLRFGKKAAAAKSFSLTAENLDAMLAEATGRDSLLANEVAAVRKMLPAFGGEITPAMMFGKILPMYTVVTERTLGAPDPKSSSLFGILGGYAGLSRKQVEITDRIGDLVGVIGAHNLAPVARTRTVEGREIDVRFNPDYRHTVDIFTPGNPFRSAVKAVDETRDRTDEGPGKVLGDFLADPAEAEDGLFAGKKDPAVEKVANAMRALVGTWAKVEYRGGSAFTIFGDLKGDAATTKAGKPVRAVITVNVGDLLNSEGDVRALANSRAYAASLTASVNLGINADEFLNLLPEETRMRFVKRFGVGGFSSNKVAWSVSGDTIATALNVTKADNTVYHEYFHSMMRMFESLGVLADADYDALAKEFGNAPTGRNWRFDEEKAADAFRAWVSSNETTGATEATGVFAKIRDFLKGLWEALKAGFSFGEDVPADETLFRMMVSGIAEGSRERKALGEVAAAVGVSQGARTIRELAEETVANLGEEARATQSLDSKETFTDLNGEDYNEKVARVNALLDRPRVNRAMLAQAVSAAIEAGIPLAEANGTDIQVSAPVETEADVSLSPAAPGTEESGIERTQAAVKLATVPLAGANMFYRTAYNITRAIEDGLKAGGSWQGELEAVIERQKDWNRRNNGIELADKAVVVRAIRDAISVINPGLKVSSKEIEGSLAFQAAHIMSGFLESSFVNPAPAGNRAEELHGTETERQRNAKKRASQYDISGWLLSSRAVLPGDSAEAAIESLRALNVTGGAARTVVNRCIAALERVAKECGDPTLTSNWVGGGSNAVLNELFPTIEAGLRKVAYDAEGVEGRYELQEEGSDNPYAKDNFDLYSQCLSDDSVQMALRTTLGTLHRIAAMDKFFRETGVVPGSFEDAEACRTFARRGIPEHVSAAEWSASQAIGPSNLADNQSLVDFQNQSGFIAAHAENWIMSQVRDSFGKEPLKERVMAEASEYVSLKADILHLENMHSFMLGDSVDAGGELLKVIEHDGHFKTEDGIVRYVEKGKKYIGFDALHRKGCGVRFTIDELRTVDVFKKMLSAYANGQKVMLTGVNRLTFNDRMSTDPASYEWEKLEERWKNANPGSQFNRMEVACVRIMRQLQIEGITGGANGTLDVYRRFVREACAAMDKAWKARAALGESARADFDFNHEVLKELRSRGIVAAQRNSDGSYRQGALVLDCDAVDRMFKASSAYAKLTSGQGGRKPEWISKETLTAEALAVHRRAMDFVKRHPWITEGDARYLNSFKTPVMFFGGSGVFMHDAIRVSRDRKYARTGSVPRYVASYRAACQKANAFEKLTERDINLLDVLSDVFRTQDQGLRLLEAINRGDYERGKPKAERTGLELSANAVHADVADAIYQRLLDVAWQEQVSDGRLKAGVRSLEEMIEAYEEEKGSADSFATGGMGMNDVTMFERFGVLPANFQLGHKIHQAIDQVTNAMMQRNTLVNMLMTPSADGAPVYLVRPSEFAREDKGKSIPEGFWGQLARWWAECYGAKYDESKDGIENAQRIYGEVVEAHKNEKTGKLHLRMPDSDEHRFTALDEKENDLVSCTGWWVMDDEDLGGESSYLNAVQGGEAMGYLRQVVQAGRVPGLGAQAARQTLQRALSWSKSLSVSFSFFFPLATRFESPIGAVGAMATMLGNSKAGSGFLREHAGLMSKLQGIMPGGGWITKDFLGFNDIIRMMDTNDPFLAELKGWAAALSITISDRLVNPMEPTKSLVIEDLKRMKRMIRDNFGEKMAAQFGNVTEALLTRQGEKAFVYALNATKLAVVAQMCSKLRHEAAKRGKAFDPVRDLRKYSGYINAEVGGIDPFSYAWATPRMRNLMNVMMFSWQWTRGAWEAGGGGAIEDLVFGGHNVTRQERKYMFGRWARMWGEIMIGVPAMMQIVCKALGMALGWDDDDDKWLTSENEGKIGVSAFDLTPLLRGIEKFDSTVLGGTVKGLKTDHGKLFGWIPMYTGTDRANQTTQRRRYYMHFGKQGWEFFRWFTDPGQQFFSKLSMPVQRTLEGLLGYNPSYPGHELPWNDMGAMERWLDPTTDGAAFNLLKAFLPFSVNGMTEFGDAGALPIFGPVSMGASQTAIQDRLVKAIGSWAHNDRAAYRWGARKTGKKGKYNYELVSDILADARRNGLDPEEQYDKALGQLMVKEYSRLFSLLPANPGDDYDVRAVSKVARTLNKLGARKASALQSIKKKLEAQGRDWTSVLTPEQREMIRSIIGEAMARPFDETEIRRDEY